MTTYNAVSRAAGVVNHAFGSFTSDNSIAVINLGFTPKVFRFFNVTDVIAWERLEGMGATISKKVVAAGTMTADATTAITFNSDGTVSLAAAAVGNAKAIVWEAYA
jgi:hypothetical protein